MKKEDNQNFHASYTAAEFIKTFSVQTVMEINNVLKQEVQTVDRDKGVGLFIREDLTIENESNLTVAIMCSWETKNSQKVVSFQKYHVYRGDIPDEVLDDINYINATTKNAVWQK